MYSAILKIAGSFVLGAAVGFIFYVWRGNELAIPLCGGAVAGAQLMRQLQQKRKKTAN